MRYHRFMRLIEPQSKLPTARGLGAETTFNTLGEMLGVDSATEDELYSTQAAWSADF